MAETGRRVRGQTGRISVRPSLPGGGHTRQNSPAGSRAQRPDTPSQPYHEPAPSGTVPTRPVRKSPRKGKKRGGGFGPVRLVLMAVFALIFVVSAYMYGSSVLESRREQQRFDEMTAMLEGASGENSMAMSEEETKLLRYAQVKEMYPDFCAWLNVPGTDVNYPVMYTPDDPEYYLRRAVDGSSAQSGTPFLGEGCDVNSDCIIVHGHHMYSGTMFNTLDRYKKESFARENTLVCFDTPEELREYTIFTVVMYDLLSLDEDELYIYNCAGDLEEGERQEMLQWLHANSLYELGDPPQNGEQIIILSTCSYHTEEGRLLVAAYRTK